ncbi:MAG: hypothetical protein EA356_05785 [Geminicoccaceae bacterium]|nr:MAG: hypothetical protein EA356_05785 [Geminicoccaceae bacterium]
MSQGRFGLSRRAWLAVATLALGGSAAVLWQGRTPPLPPMTAERRRGLVFLRASGSGGGDALNVGLPDAAPSPTLPPVDDLWPLLGDATTAPAMIQAPGTRSPGQPRIVAFYDYRCPFCRTNAPHLWRAAEAGEVDVVWREWPILGPASILAARAALAAWQQDAYLPLHQGLMTTSFVPTEGLVQDLAERHGLDLDQFDRAMASPAIDAALDHNAAIARALGAQGVPVYVVDRVVIGGGFTLPQLLRLAERYRPNA